MRQIYFHLPHYPKWLDGATKYETIVFDYFRSKNNQVHSFGHPFELKHSKHQLLNKLYKLLHVIKIIFGIVNIIRIPKNSIIILNNSPFLHFMIPRAFNRFWKNHIYILIVHDLIQKERPTYFRKIFENYFIRSAHKVIANSKTTKKDLVKLNLISENTEVVYPGLDVKRELIPDKKIFPETPSLLFVGTIEKRKGLNYLIDALSKIKNEKFKLDLVGNQKFPDFYEFLNNKINESGLEAKINFRGRVTTDELIKYYLNSSIFVFPTLYEGYGMAVAEAMAYGLPVISTKIPAIEEFLENGKDGILVEPGNTEELSSAIKTLINNDELLDTYSHNSILKSSTFLTWESASEKIYDILDKENYFA